LECFVTDPAKATDDPPVPRQPVRVLASAVGLGLELELELHRIPIGRP
jgi:hypothetical protein